MRKYEVFAAEPDFGPTFESSRCLHDQNELTPLWIINAVNLLGGNSERCKQPDELSAGGEREEQRDECECVTSENKNRAAPQRSVCCSSICLRDAGDGKVRGGAPSGPDSGICLFAPVPNGIYLSPNTAVSLLNHLLQQQEKRKKKKTVWISQFTARVRSDLPSLPVPPPALPQLRVRAGGAGTWTGNGTGAGAEANSIYPGTTGRHVAPLAGLLT